MTHFMPQGSFDLLYQNQFFNGWPTLADESTTIVMAFPLEDWQSSSGVTLRQNKDGSLELTAYGTDSSDVAVNQALAAMSLDEDGTDWPAVGVRDTHIGALQERYPKLRPTLFHSPYEAAAAFIIGHRITIAQTRKIRAQLAEAYGDKIEVNGEVFHAFPQPQKLLDIEEIKGLNETKIQRLHAVAQAAMEGWLTREYLRNLSEADALAKLETLPGVGPFFSQGILYRGCGIANGLIADGMTSAVIIESYGLPEKASAAEIKAITDRWQPYRSWATVLLHLDMRNSGKSPRGLAFKKK